MSKTAIRDEAVKVPGGWMRRILLENPSRQGMVTPEKVWSELEADPAFNEAMEQGTRQIAQQRPWNHAYEADADAVCVTCGLVGSYIHTPPDLRGQKGSGDWKFYLPVFEEIEANWRERGLIQGVYKPLKSRTYTVNQPTRTFTWPLVQPKLSLWRRLLRLVRR